MRSILICTVASLALVGSAAVADPGGKHGGGGGGNHGGGQAAHGGGGARVQSHGGGGMAQSHGGGSMRHSAPVHMAQADHKPQGNAHKAQGHAPAKQQSHGPAMKADHGPAKQAQADHKSMKADHGPAMKAQDHGNNGWKAADAKGGAMKAGNGNGQRALPKGVERVSYKGPGGREFTVPTSSRVHVVTERRDWDWNRYDVRHVYGKGCPPGLAKKYNGCMPPGLAKPAMTYDWSRPDWYFTNYDRSWDYRYYDGYMLRMGSGNSILNYIPLLGGALSPGMAWPMSYQPVGLPSYYDSYYGLGPAGGYRYYDNVIYRTDPQTSMISSVAALLTGNNMTIGQPMPMAYDVYNVPYSWRNQYYDTPNSWYRYSDGYVYQIDPTTRLVQAAIELLA